MTKGYLIIDDTVLKKYGQKIFGVSWVYSSSLKKTLQGINVVMILWTNGVVKVPLGIKVWVKRKA
ncbi:MAG: transposase [Blastocatellia bacterium]|nr:transposase [Blastocatellia bacterium]